VGQGGTVRACSVFGMSGDRGYAWGYIHLRILITVDTKDRYGCDSMDTSSANRRICQTPGR
jgi:hypothetical protein